jgi:AraC-type DNA-binding domain-containing proteins
MEKNIQIFNWHVELEDAQTDSIGKDFMLLDNPIVRSSFNYPFKVDVTTAIICIQGIMEGSINMKHYKAQGPCLFIVFPNQILQYEYISEDFEGYFIVMSTRFSDSLFSSISERLPLSRHIQDNPCIPLGSEELDAMLDFYKMIQRVIRLKDHPYRMETVTHLTKAFFYGAGHTFHNITQNEKKSKQEVLVEKFTNLVQSHYREQRGLEFYANQLCLTPKYLSKTIKESTNTSANDWIDNYVTLEAKALLKSTNMTIQQISDELNFPSQSFFGKYFKRVVGTSPKEYRNG